MNSRQILIVLLILAGLSQLAAAQWLELKQPHYSVFYQRGYKADERLVERWAAITERLMSDKYGVRPTHYRISIYLRPTPTDGVDVDNALNHCCTTVSNSFSTGSIDMLAPSSSELRGTNAISSLGMRKSSLDYSAKIFVSEHIPIAHFEVQRERLGAGWRYYDALNWFVQGLQEYDAIFHSTPTNRNSTSRRLVKWAVTHPSAFSCCKPELAINDAYNGGAAFLAFLALKFGERIHARLPRSAERTFFEALTAETKPYSQTQLFDLFQQWLRRSAPMDPSSLAPRFKRKSAIPRSRPSNKLLRKTVLRRQKIIGKSLKHFVKTHIVADGNLIRRDARDHSAAS